MSDDPNTQEQPDESAEDIAREIEEDEARNPDDDQLEQIKGG